MHSTILNRTLTQLRLNPKDNNQWRAKITKKMLTGRKTTEEVVTKLALRLLKIKDTITIHIPKSSSLPRF